MENGHIVEQGTHSGLLEQGGAYYRLYNAQFEAPAIEEAELLAVETLLEQGDTARVHDNQEGAA
jgi:ATP-binding cassette subfamily B protein